MATKKNKKEVKEVKNVSISQYADLCKVSKTAIYNRIELGEVKTTFDKEFKCNVIDINKYPAKPEKKRGRREFATK